MAYYLGIDGGGSKTTCAIGDEGSCLSKATAGPSNITRVGEVRARESLHQAIRKACAAAQIDPREIQRACIGVAGAGREEVARAIRKFVAEVIAGEIEVVGDMPIALEAAFGTGPGVVVIAGTGSFAYGRNMQGQTARAGGWGFAISDEGSAYWIGRRAIASLLRTADETLMNQNAHEISPLFRGTKTIWDLNSLDQLVSMANTNPDFATLLPAVLAAAGAGDGLAKQILMEAAEELARLAATVVRRLFPEQAACAGAEIPMAMAGGVFRHAPMVRDRFSNLVRAVHSRVALNCEVVEPVYGALQMARRAVS